MFYENNYSNSSCQKVSLNYDYQQSLQFQVKYAKIVSNNNYQEDINKCLSNVNSDYSSYETQSITFDTQETSSYLANSQDCSIKDSGITNDIDENSSTFAGKKLHMHQNKLDEDDCQLCRDTTNYLLSTPFINYFDYKFSAPNSKKISLSSDETNYVEYKLLNNFRFAMSRKIMQKDSNHGYLIHPTMIDDMHSVRTDFAMNGRTVDNNDRKMLRENEIQGLYPMTQHYDYKNELYSFQPNANSTPAKFYTQQQQQYCHVNNQNHYMNSNALAWKKPVVLDPRLSAHYDAVFPSLDVSSNNNNNFNCDKQSTSINAMDNNIEFYYCVFCKNNSEPPKVYKTHILRDITGRICCPKLRKYECPICGATGDDAHTVKYCPKNYWLMSRFSNTLDDHLECSY